MASWLRLTMRPRMRAGLISAMYIGLVMEAAPTPMPPRKRQRTNPVRVWETAVPIAEARNMTAAKIRALRRPKRSLIGPANTTPATQPARALEAAQPFIAGVRSKCVCRNPIAPAITAVS